MSHADERRVVEDDVDPLKGASDGCAIGDRAGITDGHRTSLLEIRPELGQCFQTLLGARTDVLLHLLAGTRHGDNFFCQNTAFFDTILRDLSRKGHCRR